MKPERTFLKTNRGRILGMLREARRTVGEMAKILRMTENGVRAHLNALEEDGYIRQAGLMKGARKPFHAYELTAEGEKLFPKAYGQLLAELLDVLSTKLSEDELVAACEETGKRIAAKLAPGADKLAFERRVALALEVLSSMGGAASLIDEEGELVIAGAACPIAEAVHGSPRACLIAQSLVQAITRTTVRERCEKGAKPHCRFVLAPGH